MSNVRPAAGMAFDTHVQVLIIGGGACGLTAALKAKDAGAEVVVLEREPSLSGSTAMSSGFIPAAGTRCQKSTGIAGADNIEKFKSDIQAKSKHTSEPALVELAVNSIAPALDWLEVRHGLEWTLLDDFLYPGHSHYRMHTTPEKTGASLVWRLGNAAEAAGIPVLTSALVTDLLIEDDIVRGVNVQRPDGSSESSAAKYLSLPATAMAAIATSSGNTYLRWLMRPTTVMPGTWVTRFSGESPWAQKRVTSPAARDMDHWRTHTAF